MQAQYDPIEMLSAHHVGFSTPERCTRISLLRCPHKRYYNPSPLTKNAFASPSAKNAIHPQKMNFSSPSRRIMKHEDRWTAGDVDVLYIAGHAIDHQKDKIYL